MAELSDKQIERYLKRIGLGGPLPPTAQTLSAIQWAHLHTVPFENLEIVPLDQRFTLDIPAVYEKVVARNRGGFCFELNGLLAVLLESLGFEVNRMAAHFSDEADPDPFDHLVLDVTVPTRRLPLVRRCRRGTDQPGPGDPDRRGQRRRPAPRSPRGRASGWPSGWTRAGPGVRSSSWGPRRTS